MSSQPTPHVEPAEPALQTLSWPAFSVCLVVVLAIFAGLNPIWETLDVTRVDENIWWSYYPIPLLVAAALAIERKWSWGGFAIESLRLTLVKFAITYVFANTLWVIAGAPPAPVEPEVVSEAADPHGLFVPRTVPAATPVDAATVAALEGVVLDASGAPVAGAFVWIDEGVEGVFAPPAEPLVLRHDGRGYSPSRAVAQAFREVELVAEDDVLHTAYAVREATGRRLFNDAFPPGTRRTVTFPRRYGIVTLGCRVPGHDHEPTALLVVDHPFAGVTDADGRFAFEGVPSGEVTLRAVTPPGEPRVGGETSAALEPGARARATVVVQETSGAK